MHTKKARQLLKRRNVLGMLPALGIAGATALQMREGTAHADSAISTMPKESQIQTVQTVACVNDAGFVMNFDIEMLDLNTGNITLIPGKNSGNYPIDQTRSIDLSSAGIDEGTLVRPLVNAVLGKTLSGDKFARYSHNGQAATWEVRGTTLNYSVTLIGG
jgi:hypothetical protein